MINKTKLFEWYIHNRNLFNKGMSEVYNVKTLIYIYGLGQIAYKQAFNKFISIKLSVLFFMSAIIFFWTVGLVWDKWNLFFIEAEWANRRNQYIENMRKKFLKRFK